MSATYDSLGATLSAVAPSGEIATLAFRFSGTPGLVLFCIARGDDPSTAADALGVDIDTLNKHATHVETVMIRRHILHKRPEAKRWS